MNVREMPAGRELDALIAERVLGEQWRTVPNDTRLYIGSWFQMPTPWDVIDYGDERRVVLCPPFSDRLEMAWGIATRLGICVIQSEDGWYAIKPEDIEHGCVRGANFPTLTLVGREHERWEACETAPLAICRTALLSLEPVEL